VRAYDFNTKITSTAIATYNNYIIQTPANLTSSISAQPAVVGAGWTITVVMDITNIGQATAVNVGPDALALTVTGSSEPYITLLSVPSPASVTITGGSTARFT